jgi:iron complex outermembrane receptor protein
MRSRFRLLAATALLGGFVVGATGAARAADNAPAATPATISADQSHLEDIVVSARKRPELLEKTPVAVSVISDAQLQIQHSETLTDIAAMIPNLQIFRQAGVSDVASTYLRGFGAATNDPSVDLPVATYINGVYIPQSYGTLVDTFDLGSIEVDRGPQDTLLGKNSPVGAVVITTKKPTGKFGFDAEADVGSYGYWGLRARIEGPLIKDVLAANLSFLEEDGGNYTYNFYTHSRDMGGVDKQVVRAGLNFTPDDKFQWWLTASAAFNHDPQVANRDGSTATAYPPFAPGVPLSCAIFGNCTPLPWGTTNSENTAHNQSNTEFFSSQMSYRLAPVTINFNSGGMLYAGTANSDIDGEPQDIIEAVNGRNVYSTESGEFRISSNKGGGWDLGEKLDWLVGVYAFNENFRQNSNLEAFGSPVDTIQKGDNKSQALFAHFVYNLTSELNISFGIRHTWDQKTHSYQPAGGSWYTDNPASWQNTSVEAGVQYQITNDKMIYFRFAQGYRGGGFVGVPGTAGQPDLFQPETNNTYEIGAKTQWLDRRLRLNVDFFRGNYKNLQENVWLQDKSVATNLISLTENVASATVQGVEVEAQAVPTKGLTFGVNLGFLHTAYDNYFADVVGNGIPLQLANLQYFAFSPHFTGDFNGSYKFDIGSGGALTVRGDVSVRTSQYLDPVSSPQAFQPAYSLVNASLKWDDPQGRFSIMVFGKNIANHHYEVDTAPISLVTVLVDGQPATWGVALKTHF